MSGFAVALLIVVLAAPGRAAEVDTSAVPVLEPLDEWPLLASALSLVIVPKIFADGVELKRFVGSEEFAGIRARWGDAYALDVLFRRAQHLCWNNTFCALVITLFAVVDHRRVGIRTPVPGLVLWFPLTGEFPEEYAVRVEGLPESVAADSRAAGGRDRDKLQHFFGSALLAFLSSSGEVVDSFGEFIEWGEERFIVGGVNDARDLEANRRGRSFGLRLLEDTDVRPSVFLREPLAQPSDSLRFHVGQEHSP